jgi:hypothetical protein
MDYTKEDDIDNSTITGINTFPDRNTSGGTNNISLQNQLQLQADYVLPIGDASQFEAGYKGKQ